MAEGEQVLFLLFVYLFVFLKKNTTGRIPGTKFSERGSQVESG